MNWWWLTKLFWRLSPAKVTGYVFVTLLSATVPGVQVGLTASAVQAVVDAIGGTDASPVLTMGLLLLGLTMFQHVVSAAGQYLDTVLRLELSAKVSELIMTKGIRLDLQQYEDSEAYDQLQRAFQESGGGRVYRLMTELVSSARDTVTLLSVSVVIFSWSPWIALLVLVSPVPSMLAHLKYGKKTYEIEFARTADRRRMFYYQYLATTDHSYKEVRLFQLGSFLLERYRGLIHRFLRMDRDLARNQSLVTGSLGLISALTASGALCWAMFETIGSGQIGQLAGFMQAVGVVQVSALSVLLSVSGMYENTLFIGNLFRFLKLPEHQIRGGDLPFPAKLRHGIEFRDVTFVYPGTSVTVLEQVSFVIPAGQCAAFVGPNGAGKTTIVKLLARLYEPTSGQILVDGVPIEHYDLDDLHRNLGVIFQDFIKYDMTVRHNIGFGQVGALDDDERIRQAAVRGGAEGIVDALPGRYNAMLGRHFEEGKQLSGGQWQKIALSRAFMRQAPIVVLDEPTAAIDAEAEAEVFGRLREISRGATALLIAHRFSTVRIADKILVIDGGKVTEEGTHEELLTIDGTYARLFHLQAAGYLPEPAA
ncbi:ABC transporter ATP-binding protein [Nonomuraea sp. NPDC003709]|uniref:ABC transporter ATP-binding protein n=1 Tax=Nonomuraea sp. NPDC003709 TaxID=3154450 RepID=UPI0033B49836